MGLMRTRLLVPGLLAVLLFLGACSSGVTRSATPTSTRGASTSNPSRPTRPQPFVVRIELPSGVMVGGSRLTGHLVVENNTGATLNLLSGGKTGCTPKWTVSLSNDKIPPVEAFTTECGARPLAIKPGENRFSFILLATYSHCGGIGVNVPLKPACAGSPPTPPPLPADQYRATFTGELPGLPKPTSVPMRVTARPSR